MRCRITGVVERVGDDGRVVVDQPALGVAHEALAPACALETLRSWIGTEAQLVTLERFEQEAQGAALLPTLLVFRNEREKAFFQLLTKVKGLGARKALRAMAAPPAQIAAAIERKDAVWLAGLPEIGKRLAETIIAQLAGKVAAFVEEEERTPVAAVRSEAVETALAAMVRLGESRHEAQRKLERAMRVKPGATADELLALAYSGGSEAADGTAEHSSRGEAKRRS